MTALLNTSFPDKNNPADFQWLLSLFKRLRPDIAGAGDEPLNFRKWLLLSGIKEYMALAENETLKDVLQTRVKNSGVSQLLAWLYSFREDVRQAYPADKNPHGFLNWFYTHGVDEHGLLPVLGQAEMAAYSALHPEMDSQKIFSQKFKSPKCKFGVNLIGYAFGQLGIGEDLRMTARALAKAGVPFTIINFPPGPHIPQNDRSMEMFVRADAPYIFNIFCMTALELGRFYATNGASLFEGRYNIGYWPWELARWPGDWLDLTRLVDEVWVSSRHIYDSLAPVSSVPVLIMPLAVEIGLLSSLGRKDFGLPEDAYLFCFSFDFNSSFHRKNPGACFEAFAKAFPENSGEKVNAGMVIKCHRPALPAESWNQLKSLAGTDARIRIIEETLPRPDLLALYKSCNCYLSLHRAEGFGRGLAEALLLGLEVIATGYSGNVDYCASSARAKLTRYKLIPVGSGQYPYWEGQYWADPDIGHAAQLMRNLALSSSTKEKCEEYIFDLTHAGKNYKRRLERLWHLFNQSTAGRAEYDFAI